MKMFEIGVFSGCIFMQFNCSFNDDYLCKFYLKVVSSRLVTIILYSKVNEILRAKRGLRLSRHVIMLA